MAAKYKRRAIDNIKFSIGAKLIIIISFIVIVSLGSVTALVSWLVHQDLRITAEDNNLEVNRRSAMEAESAIMNIRSNSRVLMHTITAVGPGSNIAKETVDYFFSENQQIAALYFVEPGKSEQLYVNTVFFSSRGLEDTAAGNFFKEQRIALGRAVRGETLLNNASPFFARPCLALYFPWSQGGVGAVLFSSENLNNNFGFGVNQSFMVNSDGDILAISDFSILNNAVNLAGESFFFDIVNNTQRSRQQLIEADLGFMEDSSAVVASGFAAIAWDKAGEIWVKVKNIWDKIWQKASVYIPALKKIETSKEESEKPARYFLAYTKLNIAGTVIVTSIEYDKVFEGIAATTRRNIYFTIAVLCISIIFIWYFSKTLSVPLRTLAYAARKIEGGNFDIDLKAKGHDEVGILMGSFHKMSKALNIFGRFTNKEIAIKAMRGEIKPGGFPKHGTVFFSDIRDFTAKSEQFTLVFGSGASDKIVSWLNSYFTQMVDCVEKTNGVVDKFIGDAVMAHWGTAYSAGSPRKDAFNCVKSALMMRKCLFYLNKSRQENDPEFPLIKIGCGINTGIVTAGQLGSDMRMEYTVIGDPVNLASRIEALTKPLGADILISEDTWKLVGDKFITEEMPPVTVKGKEKPVRIFAVVNFLGETKGPQTLREVRQLLNIEPPGTNNADINTDEKKYKIGMDDKNEIEELGDPADLLDISLDE
ncbi:MAG: HAMP domain-containing protein [Treponema sp.]|jgi:adenylate cyclase|nr:HAMP domain-containing protein [Treponema sp.]